MRNLFISLSLSWFFTGCSHLFYQPMEPHYVDPSKFKINYQDVYFPSKDGIKLHGWFFPATSGKPKGTITMFHGNAQNLSTHFFSLIWIIKHGYNLFIFDYRGYGKSEGEPSQEGVYHDALSGMKKGLELNSSHGNGKYIIYGQSLGGIISLRALPDFSEQDEVDLIVQDSTFSSYKDIAFNRLMTRWFLIPFSPLAFILVSDEYASDEVFEKIKTPLHVIVGQKDPIIPQKFGKEIYREIDVEPKWLWKLPEGGHIDIFHGQHEKYRKKFLDLLDSLGQK